MRGREKGTLKDREKFTIIVRVRPRLKEDNYTYRDNDMEEILDVLMISQRVTLAV